MSSKRYFTLKKGCFCPTIIKDEDGYLHEILPDSIDFALGDCSNCPDNPQNKKEKKGGLKI